MAIRLESLRPTLQNRVIRRAANATLLPALRAATPRDSGNLARSLAIRQTRTRQGTALRLGHLATGRFTRGRISGNHAHFIEFGTRERIRRNGKRTGRVRPRPYFFRTLDTNLNAYTDAMRREYQMETNMIVRRVDRRLP